MIVFSHEIFSAQAAGGVSRCMIELMRALGPRFDWRLWAGTYTNDLLSDALTDPAFAAGVLSARAGGRGGRFRGAIRNETAFAAAVAAQRARLVHRSYYPVLDLLPRRGIQRIETLHDMWDEQDGGRAGSWTPLKTNIKRRALHRADAIVCVSANSRAELLHLWPQLEKRSIVIPHGVRPLSSQPTPAGRDRPYFLFVGRRSSYKNFAVALAGLRATRSSDHELLAFGGGAFDAAENAAIADAGLTGRVVQLGGGDDRLAGLYESATALLYPSAYEGFGLPLLEAMIHGCPVIAAPLTSLPEVGGDAALYADPNRPDAWGEAMARLASDEAAANAIRAAGRARAGSFGWDQTAQKHAALYTDITGIH